jgi:hypothetical protein
MTGSQLKFVSLCRMQPHVLDGDLLLFRRRGLVAIAGRGLHSHAAKAAWWDDDLFCLEVREWHGGRAVTLASQVARFPARIDWFRANPENLWPHYDRAGATRVMRRLAGCAYGYAHVLAASFCHLPFVRLFSEADLSDGKPNGKPPFCSEACAASDRVGGGVDPVPHLADRMTLPADLARSPFYEYQCTLLP